MSFIFISHLDDDKPRIKPITDHLIKFGWKLFIDQPDEMGYTSIEIRRSILRIMEGQSWLSSIDKALSESACVLLFASRNLLKKDEKHSTLKREVLIGQYFDKLVTVVIEDFDLRALGSDFPIRGNQYLNFFLPYEEGPSFDRKIERLDESIQKKCEQRRAKQNGPFSASATIMTLTMDQVEQYVMMLDREKEAADFSRSDFFLNLVIADEAACPAHFKRRLAEIDLPRKVLLFDEGDDDAVQFRAKLLRGHFDENRWSRRRFTWIARGDPNPERDRDRLIEQIIHDGFPRISLRTENETVENLINRLEENLRVSRKAVLLTTFFEDEPEIRDRNAFLLLSLAKLLKEISGNHCRLLIRVGPASKSSPSTMEWLEGVALDARIGRVIALDKIKRHELSAWCDLMELLVDQTARNIGESLKKVFARRKNMTFQELESKLRPIVKDWQLKGGGQSSLLAPWR